MWRHMHVKNMQPVRLNCNKVNAWFRICAIPSYSPTDSQGQPTCVPSIGQCLIYLRLTVSAELLSSVVTRAFAKTYFIRNHRANPCQILWNVTYSCISSRPQSSQKLIIFYFEFSKLYFKFIFHMSTFIHEHIKVIYRSFSVLLWKLSSKLHIIW